MDSTNKQTNIPIDTQMSSLKGLIFEALEQVRMIRTTTTKNEEINSHRCLVENNTGQCGWGMPPIE